MSTQTNDQLAAAAYESLDGLEFLEMNDGHRLGFHVYRWLVGELPSLRAAIYEAKARTSIAADELEKTIRGRLDAAGVTTN